MNFYVYVYLDNTKPGKFTYDGLDLCFLYQPFYIGKGTKNRLRQHLSLCKNWQPGKNPFYDKINSLKDKPFIEKIYTDLDDETSKLIEINLIKIIGRKLNNSGCLMNMTEGGTGGNTFILLSEEQKKEALLKRSNSMKGKNKTPCSEEQKQKIREKLTGRKNPEHSLRLKGTKQTKETIKKRADNQKKKIIQLSLDNQFIKEWDSATDASLEMGYNKSSILKVCRGNRVTSNGYKWKWK